MICEKLTNQRTCPYEPIGIRRTFQSDAETTHTGKKFYYFYFVYSTLN